MPSPFPGMNPYLENRLVWSDFHLRFLAALAESIGEKVAPAYFVRAEERPYVHDRAAERHLVGIADVAVAHGDELAIKASTAVLDAPIEAYIPDVESETIAFLEVVDRKSRRVVTWIELLSPTNKLAGAGREEYLSKRREALASGVNFVEIDLLRCGQRLPITPNVTSEYCVVVSRAATRPMVNAWPIGLRDPLPVIPIPLLPADGDVSIDLKQVLDRAYDAARYELYLYEEELEPPLRPDDLEWANALVASR